MSEFLGPNTIIPVNRAAGIKEGRESIQAALAQAQALFQQHQQQQEDAEAMKHPLLRRALGMMSDPVESVRRDPPVGQQSPAVMSDAQTFLQGLGFKPTLGGVEAQQPSSSTRPVGPSAGGGSSLPTSSPAIRGSSPTGLPPSPLQSSGYTEPATGIQHPGHSAEMTVRGQAPQDPPLTPAVMRMMAKFAPYIAQVKAAQVGSQGRYDNTELAKIMDAQANRLSASVKLTQAKAKYDTDIREIAASIKRAKSGSDLVRAWIAAANLKQRTAATVKDYHAASSEDHPDAQAARAQANEAAQLEMQIRQRLGLDKKPSEDPSATLKKLAPGLMEHLQKFPQEQWKAETEAFLGD